MCDFLVLEWYFPFEYNYGEFGNNKKELFLTHHFRADRVGPCNSSENRHLHARCGGVSREQEARLDGELGTNQDKKRNTRLINL